MKALALIFLLPSIALAEPKISYRHLCPDAGSQIISECTMRYTQAASFDETRKQIKLAIKNTRFRGKLKFISIDPFSTTQWDNNRDYYWNMYLNEGGSILYGVWFRPSKIYISAMPGCANIRLMLEDMLRDIQRGKARSLPFPKRVKPIGLEQYLRGEAPVFENLELPDYLK